MQPDHLDTAPPTGVPGPATEWSEPGSASGDRRSVRPPDELEQMVPVRRRAVVGIVVVALVAAVLAAYLWWITFPSVDDEARSGARPVSVEGSDAG